MSLINTENMSIFLGLLLAMLIILSTFIFAYEVSGIGEDND